MEVNCISPLFTAFCLLLLFYNIHIDLVDYAARTSDYLSSILTLIFQFKFSKYKKMK